MDYTKPADVVAAMIDASVKKLALGPRDILIRGALSGGGAATDWWLWNQIPVTLGNLVGGFVFTGLALYATYKPAPLSAAAAPIAIQAAAE